MSSNTLERIKGVRQYNASKESFSDFVPFGTDAHLVDVFSELDLEEELILGGNTYTSLTTETDDTGTDITVIIQKFQNKEEDVLYTKRTIIKAVPNIDLIEGQSTNSVIGDTTNSFVIGNFRGKENILVYMYLYNGEYLTQEEQEQLWNSWKEEKDLLEVQLAELLQQEQTEDVINRINEIRSRINQLAIMLDEQQIQAPLIHKKRILVTANQITQTLDNFDQEEFDI